MCGETILHNTIIVDTWHYGLVNTRNTKSEPSCKLWVSVNIVSVFVHHCNKCITLMQYVSNRKLCVRMTEGVWEFSELSA